MCLNIRRAELQNTVKSVFAGVMVDVPPRVANWV
jgi:hypothetical protein